MFSPTHTSHRQPIFLVGLPASGKTTLGQAAARALGLQFIDLDKEIERQAAMTTREIFEQCGEQRFRELESTVLTRFATTVNTIIATGGGTPCHGCNMDMMLNSGIVVNLEASDNTLARRIALTPGQRPLVGGTDRGTIMRYISATRLARESHYRRAHISIDSNRLETTREIVDTVNIFIRLIHDNI